MFILWGAANANNIQITNVIVVPTNNTIKFNLSWENGWRSTVLNNWDAAWVFFKYKNPSGNWTHLNLTNTGNVIPGGFSATVSADFIGVMLFRSTAGNGLTTLTNVELGIASAQASGLFDINAFAIEMVNVPSGSYYAGDGTSTNSFTINQITGAIGAGSEIYDPITAQTISFQNSPNGAFGFYCMKYELSQGGYRDFLNTLTYTQQIAHMAPAPSAATGTYVLYNLNRNSIKIKTAGIASVTPAIIGCDADNDGIFDETNDGENIACNFLNWVDHAAYLDWAGLFPLNELQYEKSARGILLPVGGEYVWGNIQITASIFTIANPNQASEIVSNSSAALGNANYNNTYPNAPYIGPIRNGVFATLTSNRITSGGSFYGIMEMSGNLHERVIRLSSFGSLDFDYTSDGVLTSDGFCNSMNWPGTGPSGLTPVNGSSSAGRLMYRGGSWLTPSDRLRSSDRGGFLVIDANTNRTLMHDVGVRGTR